MYESYSTLSYTDRSVYAITGYYSHLILNAILPQGEVVKFEITVKGHEMKVNGITPSPNGQLVLSVSDDGKLQIRKSNDMVSLVYYFKYVKYGRLP